MQHKLCRCALALVLSLSISLAALLASAVNADEKKPKRDKFASSLKRLKWDKAKQVAVEKPDKPNNKKPKENAEADAETAGVTTFQGHGEQHGHKFPRLRRTMLRWRWPTASGKRFYMPPRIAFEPSNVERIGQNSLIDHTHRTVRNSWRRAQPAVVSSHRLNYAHLEGERSARGRGMLRDLLKRMVEDGAVFLVDAEVRQLHDRNWSVREIGKRGALVRYHGVPRDPIRFAAPNGTRSATLRESRGPDDADVKLDGGQVTARLNVGEYLVEWGT